MSGAGLARGFEQRMKTGIFVPVLTVSSTLFAKLEHSLLESAAAQCHLKLHAWGQDLSNSLRFYIYCPAPGLRTRLPFPKPLELPVSGQRWGKEALPITGEHKYLLMRSSLPAAATQTQILRPNLFFAQARGRRWYGQLSLGQQR